MEIPPEIHQRLSDANQLHLITYWSELNDDQRQILLHDLHEIDFKRVKKAYDGIKPELLGTPSAQNGCDNQDNIDDIMEPIPDDITDSISQASQEQLDNYRRQGQSHCDDAQAHKKSFSFRFTSYIRRTTMCFTAGWRPRNSSW